MSVEITDKGGGEPWKKTALWLAGIGGTAGALYYKVMQTLNHYGQIGVDALAANTPVDTGATAGAWRYSVEKDLKGFKITWYNDNINQDVNIALILQYGHGTGTGGYVEGIDYINPALRGVFEEIADAVVTEVSKE